MRRSILPTHINLNDFQRLRLHAAPPERLRSPIASASRRRVRLQYLHCARDLQAAGHSA